LVGNDALANLPTMHAEIARQGLDGVAFLTTCEIAMPA
jgi:hypothetical protein